MATNKEILINAFDMSTIGHLSPGQWKASIGHIHGFTATD
jgi:hypothetical protein